MAKRIFSAAVAAAICCAAALGCRTRAPLMVAHRGAGDLEMPEASLAADGSKGSDPSVYVFTV